MGIDVAEMTGIAVKRKPFADTKRGERNRNSSGRNRAYPGGGGSHTRTGPGRPPGTTTKHANKEGWIQ